jgi:hypothetical protein
VEDEVLDLDELSRSPVPRETPLPLKAENVLFYSSCGCDGAEDLSVAVPLEFPPPKKLDIIPPEPPLD